MLENAQGGRRIVVVGGGVAGLAAAHKLTELCSPQAGPAVLLLEAGERLGGVIRTVRDQECILECGPDSFITQKPWALDLCRRLGVSDRLIETNESCRRTFVAWRGKLQPVPEGFIMLAPTRWLPFVASPLFSPLGKLRMAADLFLPRRASDADESLADFVLRRLGREALDRIAQPMVGGIYTADPSLLSLKATVPRFLEMEKEYGSVIRGMTSEQRAGSNNGSGARYSMFVSFDQGMQVLVDALSDKLPDGCVRLRTPVSQVVPGSQGRRWDVILSGGESIAADGVVISGPAHAAAALTAKLDDTLSADLGSIDYASSAVLNLVFNRADIAHRLDGFGFVAPASEPLSIIACSFSSVKFSGRAPADKTLLRVFAGGALKPELNDLSDDELLQAVTTDLGALLRISSPPLFSSVVRWPRSMPQYRVGHLDLVERIESRLAALPGIAIAGNAYRGVGIPDCIHSGEQAAEAVVKQVVSG